MKIKRKYFQDGVYLSYDEEQSDLIIANLNNNHIYGKDNSIKALRFIGCHTKQKDSESVIIDCGCHIGTFALPFYDMVKRVVCIDGSETNIQCLKDTLLQDQFSNITAIHCILDRCKRQCSFSDSGPFGSINFDKNNLLSDKLDSILKNEETISLIKYDLEGSELNAIKGSNDIISKHRPYLITELNPLCLSYHQTSILDLFHIIESHDYDIFLLEQIGIGSCLYFRILEKHANEDFFPMGSVNDLFCIPREKIYQHTCTCGFCFNITDIVEM
jgi:FkbM family methyltransferase